MIEIQGSHTIVNIQLNELSEDTKDLAVRSHDREPIELYHSLLEKDIILERLSLTHVNLNLEESQEKKKELPNAPRNNKRRLSSFNNKSQVPDVEQTRLKDQQELVLYKAVFAKWSGLSHLEIEDGAGVLSEPIHFIKSLSVTVPQLESLKIMKTMRKKSSNDDLMILDSETMGSLTQLNNLRVLHLLGFAGRQNRYQRFLFTNLDNAVESLAHKGKLEEFHFSESGITYKGIFSLIKHCKDLRDLNVRSRFGNPGLFTLHHNLPFMKLGDHHQDSAVYEPEDDSPRQLVLTLTNVLMEQSRYDPAWVDDTYPEEKITVKDLVKANGFDHSDGE